MSGDLVHLGPMYRRLGLDTDATIIAGRVSAATAAYKEMSADQLCEVLRMALGRPVDGDLDSVVEQVKNVDVTFDSSAGIRELALIATAILQESIVSGGFGGKAALGTVVAGFGGLRRFEADPEILETAQRVLAEEQDSGQPLVSPIKWTKRPALDDDQASLLTYAQQGNIAAAHPHLKKILDSGFSYTERAYNSLTQQSNALASAHNRLAEQMNVHWWVMNGWSLDVSGPFSELGAGDAALRAGAELARLTTSSPQGLFSAQALLSRLLKASGFNPGEEISIRDGLTASPIGWRRKWAESWAASSTSASLLPVTLAASIAVEASDEPDWVRRFERVSGISAEANVSLLGLSYQLYLEMLLRPNIAL